MFPLSGRYVPVCENDDCVAGNKGFYGSSKKEAVKAWNSRIERRKDAVLETRY